MIVILRFQEDLEPAEIAQILEIPLGTVKSNLHRSLKVLRKRLERPDRPLSGRDRNQNLQSRGHNQNIQSRDRKGAVGVNP
jgi:RNA polymerase sigma-70 factor (ECF subfamily)